MNGSPVQVASIKPLCAVCLALKRTGPKALTCLGIVHPKGRYYEHGLSEVLKAFPFLSEKSLADEIEARGYKPEALNGEGPIPDSMKVQREVK